MLVRTKIGISLIIITIAVTSTISIIHSQKRDNSNNQSTNKQQDDGKAAIKKIEENGDPIADYNFSESSDTPENNLRKKRKAKNNLNSPNHKPGDAKRFELNDNSQPINVGGPWIGSPRRPALPITQDNFVVVGEVIDAQAFLSDDKTNIFSEFSFRVEDVLKQNAEQPVSINEVITTERAGGKVKLPSGKMLHRLVEGVPMPKMGKRYVMFLKYDKETDSSYIITGYKLEAGKVTPLDGMGLEGQIVQSLENFQQYDSVDENSFLNTVRNAILDFTLNDKGGQK
jgi:hypothetical protein